MKTLVNFGMCILHSKFPRGWSFFNVTDIPHLFGLRAEVTADNTSIRVSWRWSRDGLPICVDMVTVHYQPEGSSPMSTQQAVQQPVPPCPTSTATQSTLFGFMLKMVKLLKQVTSVWFLYQQEVNAFVCNEICNDVCLLTCTFTTVPL